MLQGHLVISVSLKVIRFKWKMRRGERQRAKKVNRRVLKRRGDSETTATQREVKMLEILIQERDRLRELETAKKQKVESVPVPGLAVQKQEGHGSVE